MDNETTNNNQIDLKNSMGYVDGAGEREERWDNKVIIIIAVMSWGPITYWGHVLGLYKNHFPPSLIIFSEMRNQWLVDDKGLCNDIQQILYFILYVKGNSFKMKNDRINLLF